MSEFRGATPMLADSERNVLRNIKRTGAEDCRVPARSGHDVRNEKGYLAHRVPWKWVAHAFSPRPHHSARSRR
jgi:hypothetical protein